MYPFATQREFALNQWYVAARTAEVTHNLTIRRVMALPILLYRPEAGEVSRRGQPRRGGRPACISAPMQRPYAGDFSLSVLSPRRDHSQARRCVANGCASRLRSTSSCCAVI